jgi:hypothetical protein
MDFSALRVAGDGRFLAGLGMGQVVPFLRPQTTFDFDTTPILIAAYETAVEGIEDRRQPGVLREIAARRIIALALRGERNPARLCAAALATIGRTKTAA